MTNPWAPMGLTTIFARGYRSRRARRVRSSVFRATTSPSLTTSTPRSVGVRPSRSMIRAVVLPAPMI